MIGFEEFSGNPTDGDGQHVAVNVGGVRIAGAVRLRERYSATDPNAFSWYLTPCIIGAQLRPTQIRDEAHARQWLCFLADLYCANVSGCDEPPVDLESAELLTEADFAGDEEVSSAELDDDERAFWDEVRSCCGGRSFWCSHYRQYPSAVVTDRW